MKKSEIYKQIIGKQSYLCVGLDTELEKLPKHLEKNGKGLLTFNKKIIKSNNS